MVQRLLFIVHEYQQLAADEPTTFARLCVRFLARFREFLLPADAADPSLFAFFFFLHDNGFGPPLARFRPRARFPSRVDAFRQSSVDCSWAAGSIMVWTRSAAASREFSDGASTLMALNATYSSATPGSCRMRCVRFSSWNQRKSKAGLA